MTINQRIAKYEICHGILPIFQLFSFFNFYRIHRFFRLYVTILPIVILTKIFPTLIPSIASTRERIV